MAAKRYELSDEQWEMIKDMFPKAKTGRPPKDNQPYYLKRYLLVGTKRRRMGRYS